jgi:hypothetical protein
MGQRTLVPDAGEVILHELKTIGRDRLVMVLRPAGVRSRCPVCDRASGRIHSRYSRHLSDLPWEGIPVRIELQVRRFFCGSEACGQRIFTERLPNTVQCYSRRTYRLSAALKQITLALGGSAGWGCQRGVIAPRYLLCGLYVGDGLPVKYDAAPSDFRSQGVVPSSSSASREHTTGSTSPLAFRSCR